MNTYRFEEILNTDIIIQLDAPDEYYAKRKLATVVIAPNNYKLVHVADDLDEMDDGTSNFEEDYHADVSY